MSTLLSDSPTSRDQELPQPPAAKKVPHAEVGHGERRVDDYFWLREKTNPDTRAYLDKMEKAGSSVLSGTVALSILRRHWLLLRHAMWGWTPL